MARLLVTEQTILDTAGPRLVVPTDALVTALAADAARERGVEIVRTDAAAVAPAPPAALPAAPERSIAIGCDHGGFALKTALVAEADRLGWSVLDVGTDSEASVDYPDFAFAVARAVQTGVTQRGLMIDGVGVGSAMVCNKVSGVRAALCPDVFSAYNARAHNDAHVLTLGARTMGAESCKRILAEFLTTPFEGGRHARRVGKMMEVEARFLPGDDCGCHD